jgi:hypothetical protein
MHQPCKEPRLYRNNQGDHEANGQTHNRASSDSAPKHPLFTVCHCTPPNGYGYFAIILVKCLTDVFGQ